MKRRIVVATCLAGVIAGSAGAALASPTSPVNARRNDVCVAIGQDENYHSADYYCIDINQP